MASSAPRLRRPRQRGVALLTALMVATVLSMIIGASLWVSVTHYGLNFAQTRSESALLLAEGGINDELAYIAANVGNTNVTTISSRYDYVNSGPETLQFPGENHAPYGRRGSLAGTTNEKFWVCTSANDWSKTAGTTPTPWDGKSGSFYVTSTAYVKGSWRRVSIGANGLSIFSLYAIFGLATYSNSSNAIGLSSANVDIIGTAGTNGQVSNSSSTFLASNIINANTVDNPNGQFTGSNLKTGGTLYTQGSRFTYPTTVNVLKRLKGITGLTDAQAWANLKASNSNSTGVYTYKAGASSDVISTANCSSAGTVAAIFNNNTGSGNPKVGAWSIARAKPGTSNKISTLIFEPGDYYFEKFELAYNAATEFVIDPLALASGGTPGQVRFWIFDPSNGTQNDIVSLPIKATSTTGTPDPSLFRLYYGKDGKTFTFARPSNVTDVNGVAIAGDFNVYGGVYAVTKVLNDSNSGTGIGFSGLTSAAAGRIVLKGSLLADKISFQGYCQVEYVPTGNVNDVSIGAGFTGGYSDGG
ncbi:hypothetical protein EON82_00690 [bacterium]|nr:MAG: hypothetical protein EON82_00690 [bacterium]